MGTVSNRPLDPAGSTPFDHGSSPEGLRQLRSQHPAWHLLASRRSPLVLSSLRALFNDEAVDVAEEDAVQHLAEVFADNAARDDHYKLAGRNYLRAARKELRGHIRSGLLVERGGMLAATDALLQAFRFVEALSNRPMTSTASRLTTVQHQIDQLEAKLSPDADRRIERVHAQIRELEAELDRLAVGDFEVLDGPAAVEAIREVYLLAASLRDDFRRVEDSFQQAELDLRSSIVADRSHRGAVLDQLITSNESLLETTEGKVFQSFHEQLSKTGELDAMGAKLLRVLSSPAAAEALSRSQQGEIRRLRGHLVAESNRVVQARARGERDVRNYLKTGLAAEHRQITQLIDDLFAAALEIDWSDRATRKSQVPIRPTGVSLTVPSPLRLRIKDIEIDRDDALDFTVRSVDIDAIDASFWEAYDALDREALAENTIAAVAEAGVPITMAELAERLPPSHDLESLSVWVQMAATAGCEISRDERESITVDLPLPSDPSPADDAPTALRFHVPVVWFDHDRLTAATFDL